MKLLAKLFSAGKKRAVEVPAAGRQVADIPTRSARSKDPWFWSHYNDVARIVLEMTPRECFQAGKRVVDFGCGDGASTLGVASGVSASVVGVDLMRSFDELPALAEKNLGSAHLPGNLSFKETCEGQPLPFPASSIDLAYSWSVLEHVGDVRSVLAEFRRIVTPAGFLFVQIDPLFFSPFGSHLQRLVKQPWAHLAMSNDDFLELVANAPDDVPPEEQDTMYRTHTFEQVRRNLILEYSKLNRVKASELTELVRASGFEIRCSKTTTTDLEPEKTLLDRFSREDLVTQQIVLLAVRSSD